MLLALALLLQDHVIDAFDGALRSWETQHSETSLQDGALRWEAKRPLATLANADIPEDLAPFCAVAFRVRVEGDRERAIVVHFHEKERRNFYFRRVAIRPGDWQSVEIPLWRFRSNGVPSFRRIDQITFAAPEPGVVLLDDVKLVRAAGAGPGFLEPDDAVAARMGGEMRTARSASFRVLTNAPLDAAKLAAHLEEFHRLFRETFALPEQPLDTPATVVILRSDEEKAAFIRRTAQDVYGAEVADRHAQSPGFTFEEYAVSFHAPEHGERRPVFFHEACHLLVRRHLGLRGPKGATWLEEGLCYFFQYEFSGAADRSRAIRAMLRNPRRAPLAALAGAEPPDDLTQVQAMAVVGYLARGPHRAKLGAVVAALREKVDLGAAVEDALGVPIEEFEAGWMAWCVGQTR